MSLIGKKKDAYDTTNINVIEHTLMCAQLLASVILDQSKKHQETSVAENKENVIVDVLESYGVQVVEVMDGSKTIEAFVVPK